MLLLAKVDSQLSWHWYEQGQYSKALRHIDLCDDHIKAHTGYCFDELMKSVQAGGKSALLSPRTETSEIVSLALHIRTKILIELAAYGDLRQERQSWVMEQSTTALYKGLLLDTIPRLVQPDGTRSAVGGDSPRGYTSLQRGI
jgi:hypothetical protein